jgi:FlaA1/EpsC-like NDP-sugar epimerase
MNLRRLTVFLHDLVAVAVAWCLAFWLRFNLDIPAEFATTMWQRLPLPLAVHCVLFWSLGLYRGLWRYASLPDAQRILLAAGVGALAVPAAFAVLGWLAGVPRSVFLIAPVLLVVMMGGSRLAYRAWREGRLLALVARPRAMPVLVIGAGGAAATLLKELAASQDWRVVGLLDDDAQKRGTEIHGVKVLGRTDQLAPIAERLGVSLAIIAMPEATHKERQRVVGLCNEANVGVMTVPALSDIVAGKVNVSALRPIELEDLLGRDPVVLDDAGLHALLTERTVLVTGAGGSIGAELCRQIAAFAPRRLVLFELSEFALYGIEQEFGDRFPARALTALIGDAKDEARIAEVFRRYRPQVVFHAAAYKHVPLMEEENAYQAVVNNVLSTLVLARAAQRAAVEKFVLVSTDKAVNPVNVMGASKRLAELVCQALQPDGTTQFVIVRFGNVLGSTGSVVPRFREQIARGGPVTVTHPEMQRYFMSIPEAAQLVLQAAFMGKGGEIYVLDMGEPVKIAELARQMIHLSGLTEADIPIQYTGLRPGEKLYEEPLADAETTLQTPHPKLRIARVRAPEHARLAEEVAQWLTGTREPAATEVRAQLARWIAEYSPGDSAAVVRTEPLRKAL